MKILKSLNKKFTLILFLLLFSHNSLAEDKPVDIWNIDKKKNQGDVIDETLDQDLSNKPKANESNIYKMQSQKETDSIKLEQSLDIDQVKIIGLYDPNDYSLDIDMWLNSDGDQLKNIFSKLLKLELSKDAREIMNISMLTNSYPPKKNITNKEFFEYKSNWLIKNSDLDLIKNYLIKNQIINTHTKLTKFFLDQYLSKSKIEKACELFKKSSEDLKNDYINKYNIYCLIINNQIEQAQLIYDLKKELGFNDEYFQKKINFLLNYTSEIDKSISEKSILDFHLAHKTNPEFVFEPNEKTKKIIWQYLSSENLLNSFKEIETSDLDKIALIEQAVNNKNYPEIDLLNIYRRFQFNINQLLNAESLYKSLGNIEGRALIYQKILLESEMIEKLKLLKILKESFDKDNLNNVFDTELKKFLKDIDPAEIPYNFTSFYYANAAADKNIEKKIKFNNDILHQSKLINYFNGDYSKVKIEKDLNNFLKKIKKNKKYKLSTKDKIFITSLKSDGIKIDKKYDNLFHDDLSEIPTDIQVMINNNEKGAAVLRIIEVIGQDELEKMDDDTISFIISTLNQLNIDIIRNKILLKVLPLKV